MNKLQKKLRNINKNNRQLKILRKFELSFQGHNKNESSENRGVFKGLTNFINTFEPYLQKHLDSNSVLSAQQKQNRLPYCRVEDR